LGDEILTPVLTLGYYLKLLIIPYPLNAFVPRLPRGDFQSLIYLLTGTGGMAVLLWIFLRKIRTLYAVGAAWFVLGMAAPLMVPLAKVAVTPVAERYVYLASGGFLLMVSLGGYHGGRWIRSRWSVPIAVGGLAIVIGLFSVLTVDRNRIWRNEAVLWKDAVLKSPAAVLPHYNLGIAYRSIGRLEEAAEEFRTTLKLDPRYPLAHTNLGIVYKEMGRSEEAIQEYRGELELQSDQAEASYKAHNNLGIVYKDLGRYEEALQEFQTALLRQPNSFKPHFNLGAAYEEMGRLDEAIREYRAGLAINPKDAKAHINLGIVYANLGKFREAVAELKTVVRLKPDDASARVVLGDLYKELGRPEEAKAEYQHALRIKPDFDAARKALESLPKQK
jgi:tetratricopeptide (TPR) repeat protein